MFFRRAIFALSTSFLFATTPAAAQGMICDVNTLAPIGVSGAGALLVTFKGAGVINLCSMAAVDRGITKEGCAAWYSALMAAKAARWNARFYFELTDPANAGVTSCETLGNWATRSSYFFETF
jgi:hypothetical protein